MSINVWELFQIKVSFLKKTEILIFIIKKVVFIRKDNFYNKKKIFILKKGTNRVVVN